MTNIIPEQSKQKNKRLQYLIIAKKWVILGVSVASDIIKHM